MSDIIFERPSCETCFFGNYDIDDGDITWTCERVPGAGIDASSICMNFVNWGNGIRLRTAAKQNEEHRKSYDKLLEVNRELVARKDKIKVPTTF